MKEEWAVILENKSFFLQRGSWAHKMENTRGKKSNLGSQPAGLGAVRPPCFCLNCPPHTQPPPTQNAFPGQRHHKPSACPCLSKSQRTTVGRERPALPDPCKSQGPSMFPPALSLHLGTLEPRVRWVLSTAPGNQPSLRGSCSAPKRSTSPGLGPGVYNDFLCVNSFPISPHILDLLVKRTEFT